MEYATRLMVALVRVHDAEPMAADRLSQAENVPVDYVNQILLKLRRAGLVASQRGQHGGYTLSRKPEDVSLGQVLRAVEGKIFEDVCEKYSAAEKDCRHQEGCGISPVWKKLGIMIEQYFDGITLAALVDGKVACGAVFKSGGF
jgi:Rrf2 family protein